MQVAERVQGVLEDSPVDFGKPMMGMRSTKASLRAASEFASMSKDAAFVLRILLVAFVLLSCSRSLWRVLVCFCFEAAAAAVFSFEARPDFVLPCGISYPIPQTPHTHTRERERERCNDE